MEAAEDLMCFVRPSFGDEPSRTFRDYKSLVGINSPVCGKFLLKNVPRPRQIAQMTNTAFGKRQAKEPAEVGALKVPNLQILVGCKRHAALRVLPNPIGCSISDINEAAVCSCHQSTRMWWSDLCKIDGHRSKCMSSGKAGNESGDYVLEPVSETPCWYSIEM